MELSKGVQSLTGGSLRSLRIHVLGKGMNPPHTSHELKKKLKKTKGKKKAAQLKHFKHCKENLIGQVRYRILLLLQMDNDM